MKIKKIDLSPLQIPFKTDAAFNVAYGVMTRCESVIVTIYTDDGITGYGEATPVFWFNGETPDSVMAYLQRTTKNLVGSNPLDIEAAMDFLDTVPGNISAKSGVDLALYDIMGKASNQPVYRLLGGFRKERIALHKTISTGEPEVMAKNAAKGVEEGFRAIEIKLGKVGGDTNIDLEVKRVKRVREAIGQDIPMIVDANTGWSVQVAISVIKRIEDQGVLVEQPCRTVTELSEVKKKVSVPIIADESCSSIEDLGRIIREDAADIISIKPTKLGGLLKSKRIIQLAEAMGLSYRYDGMNQTRLAATASLHLAITTTKEICGGFAQPMRNSFDIVKGEGLLIENGSAHLEYAQRPGFGVEIDESKLEPTRVAVS